MPRSFTLRFTLGLLASLALSFTLLGCDKSKTQADTSEPASDSETSNLCETYDSCDGCIAGLQAEGKDEGEAETACAMAVTGCWTTWDKPVTCGDETYDEKPAG